MIKAKKIGNCFFVFISTACQILLKYCQIFLQNFPEFPKASNRSLYQVYLRHLRVSFTPCAAHGLLRRFRRLHVTFAHKVHAHTHSHTHAHTCISIKHAHTLTYIPHTLCTFTSINYEICTKKLQLLSRLCYCTATPLLDAQPYSLSPLSHAIVCAFNKQAE